MTGVDKRVSVGVELFLHIDELRYVVSKESRCENLSTQRDQKSGAGHDRM